MLHQQGSKCEQSNPLRLFIDKEVNVLKLTIKPGEYINIGDDVRVIYSGGSEGNIHLLIDAPRELNIVRSKVLARNTANSDKKESRYISPYYAERGLSPETLSKIRRLIREDKKMNKQDSNMEGNTMNIHKVDRETNKSVIDKEY